MKKFFFRFILFVLILIIADWTIGSVLKRMYSKSKYYTISKLKHTLNASEDILIFGSSRAQHHYNSNKISKETGLSVYNCGFGGQGLKFSYLQLESILKHHKPKLIILDLAVNILLDDLGDSKLGILKPFYEDNSEIEKELYGIDKFEKLKQLSKIYPYNNEVFNLIRNKEKNNGFSGFLPLKGNIDSIGIYTIVEKGFNKKLEIKDKVEYAEKFIRECERKGVNLVIVNSPIFYSNEILISLNNNMRSIILAKTDYQYIDFSQDNSFIGKSEYFFDNLHLNERGADAFSNVIINKVTNLSNE